MHNGQLPVLAFFRMVLPLRNRRKPPGLAWAYMAHYLYAGMTDIGFRTAEETSVMESVRAKEPKYRSCPIPGRVATLGLSLGVAPIIDSELF